jgi:hypothetical protein
VNLLAFPLVSTKQFFVIFLTMPNWLERSFDNICDKTDPPVKTVLKTRDPAKALSRRGESGTRLTRRERAANLEDADLQRKMTNAQRKMGKNFGGVGGSGAKALLSVKALHLHLAPGAFIDAGANTYGVGKQLARYNDYENESLARGRPHQRSSNDGTIRQDLKGAVAVESGRCGATVVSSQPPAESGYLLSVER